MAIILNDIYAIPCEKFSYRDGCFVAEASEIGNTPGSSYKPSHALLRQIYDDACDFGIAIRGRRHVIRYYLASAEGDCEEAAGWRFEPIAEDVRRYPECAGTSVLIIND